MGHTKIICTLGLSIAKQISGLVQQKIYNKAPVVDQKCILPNLVLVSFICLSVTGESFLVGTKEIENGKFFTLKGCLKAFSNLKTIFFTYWFWSKKIKCPLCILVIPKHYFASPRRDRMNLLLRYNSKDCQKLSLLA